MGMISLKQTMVPSEVAVRSLQFTEKNELIFGMTGKDAALPNAVLCTPDLGEPRALGRAVQAGKKEKHV